MTHRPPITMARRQLALIAFLVGFALPGLAADRPNVVILVADDLGYADPSFRGSDIATPAIDGLAAQGMELRRLDMSEDIERHTVSRCIGAPPGYVGFYQGCLLTEEIIKHPHAVVLLNEIENAHPFLFFFFLLFFFSGRRRHTRSLCDWISDVGSSDLQFLQNLSHPHFRLDASVIQCQRLAESLARFLPLSLLSQHQSRVEAGRERVGVPRHGPLPVLRGPGQIPAPRQ